MFLMTAPKADDGYDVVEFLIGKGTLPATMRETQAVLRKGVQEMDALFPGMTNRLNQGALMLSREQGRARAAEIPPGQPSPETLHMLNGSGGLSVYMLPQQAAQPKADLPTPAKPVLSELARKYEKAYLANPHYAKVGLSLEAFAKSQALADSIPARRSVHVPSPKLESAPAEAAAPIATGPVNPLIGKPQPYGVGSDTVFAETATSQPAVSGPHADEIFGAADGPHVPMADCPLVNRYPRPGEIGSDCF